jgi:hypothetical protein
LAAPVPRQPRAGGWRRFGPAGGTGAGVAARAAGLPLRGIAPRTVAGARLTAGAGVPVSGGKAVRPLVTLAVTARTAPAAPAPGSIGVVTIPVIATVPGARMAVRSALARIGPAELAGIIAGRAKTALINTALIGTAVAAATPLRPSAGRSLGGSLLAGAAGTWCAVVGGAGMRHPGPGGLRGAASRPRVAALLVRDVLTLA